MKLDMKEVRKQQRAMQGERLLLLSPNTAVSAYGEPPLHIHLSTLVTLPSLATSLVPKDSGGGVEGGERQE